ncbi:MAG: hypothetical protein WA364_13330 [Candidatus Nitrosopolaris sp.]
MRSKRVVLASTILALLITIGATMILTSNLALADWKASFQHTSQIATQSASPSGMAAIMGFNKIDSSPSSSSIYASSSSTANNPYEHITSNNIYPLQRFGTIRDESPLASRTNTNSFGASAYSTLTTGNTASTLTTRTVQPMTITSEPSPAQGQQQSPTSPEVVTAQGPSQAITTTLSLAGQTTCNPTDLLRNSKCIPQSSTCDPIGITQDSKCNTRPLHYHHMFMSIGSFRHR